jgi:hypothetical protein
MQQQEEVQETVQVHTKHYEIWGNQSGAESWKYSDMQYHVTSSTPAESGYRLSK